MRRPVKTLTPSSTDFACFEEGSILDLPGGLAAAPVDRKAHDAGNTVATRAEGIERGRQANPEGTDHAGRDHSDAPCFYDLTAKYHSVGNLSVLLIPVDL